MQNLWPWLAVAAMGALHGLNPAAGWLFAAAAPAQAGGRPRLHRTLLAIASGHAASVVLVAAAVAASVRLSGAPLDASLLHGTAAVLLAAAALHHLAAHRAGRRPAASGARLALWSFGVATAHGAGLMLVPALVPLCSGDAAVRQITASGSLAPALAAVGVHMAAMVLVTGLMAAGARRTLTGWRRG